ncbi:Deoxyribodipyrimidine photo-lyase [Ascidiaceihabitans donghaensis]|uniref:Deoxyribodipyrimidine photo-lyase n=1 Tax=Ascidiaceihabitans donghaensis TaxID=1510460 RepID=A0A2R8BFZ8_9RHOB|nr:FAD-binding domain-containing protein [Ascidiaceihabitans donghaensis]SPH21986.1 Deoxyribodipyrimidine photo-lyase [Ascidiaceihabitans donghaensis]
MTKALTEFTPTRTAALTRLARFVPHAGRDYTSKRNYDLGAGRHTHVSVLSPYLRHRILTEAEVLEAVLARFSLSSAEKFIQEVFWRTYWKGWLELRPTVWRDYQQGVMRQMDAVHTQSGLHDRWEAACMSDTGIACFDAWAKELVTTGYLHNHARMWFASIWIFTLKLPWELGADFFLRHLLDGDPASNTLSWRWVAGIQTPGKTYLARPDNIVKYTEGRFQPQGLATYADALPGAQKPAPLPLPHLREPDPSKRTGLVLHTDDLSPQFVLDRVKGVDATLCLETSRRLSPLAPAPHVIDFAKAASQDVTTRWAGQLGTLSHGQSAKDIEGWAKDNGIEQIVAAVAPVGPNADALAAVKSVPVVRVRRPYDTAAWPFATHGFFKFKEKIPKLIGYLNGISTTD